MTETEKQAKIFKALGDPTRLRIVEILCGGEKCVCKIIPETNKSQPTVSIHLRILTEAGLLKHRKEGLSVYYKLSNPEIKKLMRCCKKISAAK